MTLVTWQVAAIFAAWFAVLVFVWALCTAAGRADAAADAARWQDEMDRWEWEDDQL